MGVCLVALAASRAAGCALPVVNCHLVSDSQGLHIAAERLLVLTRAGALPFILIETRTGSSIADFSGDAI